MTLINRFSTANLRGDLFGGATTAIVSLPLALAFGASQFIGEKNLMERTLGTQITLPKPVWTRLNLLWVTNFTVVGALNIIVAYLYSEEFWVSYKLYSAIGFTLVLTIITAVIISPHLSEEEVTEE